MIANRIRMKSISLGGGFQPGDFDFDNGTVSYQTNTVTFTKSGRLCVTGFADIGDIGGECYLNNIKRGFFSNQTLALLYPNALYDNGEGIFIYNVNYAVFDINVNDTMYFIFINEGGSPFGDFATVRFYLTTFDGTLISQFEITKDGF